MRYCLLILVYLAAATAPSCLAFAEIARQEPAALSVADAPASRSVGLAYEYAWHENYDTERELLTIATSRPPSPDTARAAILLAESYSIAGDRLKCDSLLKQVRRQYSDPEILAFVNIVQALSEMPAIYSTHARKLRSDAERSRDLYAEAAEKWKGTWLGGCSY